MEHLIMYVFVFLVSLLSLTVSILFYKHKSQFWQPNIPPGTVGIPILGESLEFLSTGWKGKPEKFIFDRMNKYKSDVFKSSILGVPAAIFCGPACNKFLFSNENKLLTAWWPPSFKKIFPSSRKTNPIENSKKLKIHLPTFLKPEALQRYIGTMDEQAERHFASLWDNNEQVLVFPLSKSFTFSLACRLFVNLDDQAHVDRLLGPFELISGGIISVPIDLPGTPFNKAIKAAAFIRKELLAIIKQRKADLAQGKAPLIPDILSHMLLTSDATGIFMNDVDIADKILGLLIGSHDNASSACTFIVKYLAELPHIYDAVYKEQMEIANAKAGGELLNWDDIQKMKYSWNVVCEVLRLASPVQGLFRVALNDFVFNGFYIPKGWKVYLSSSSTHKNGDYFREPEKFEPSRFEGEGPAPFTYMPFGGGPRMCPGKGYAKLEILVFMHHLVRRFKWEKLLHNEKIIYDPMPIPQKGLPVRLFPHKKSA